MTSLPSWATAGGLAVAAVFYFALGSDLSLDWVDEGQVVYFSWRVSEGALPYRDFQNIYGPSVFLLNGGLLAAFGADVAVIRVLLVVIKSTLSILVYLCSLRLGSRPLAVAAWLGAVVTLGLPWPYFTTPYANYFGLTLGMAGLLLFVSLGGPLARRCLIAGLCFGVAATFKQTNGLFVFCALLLYLTSFRREGVAPESAPGPARLAAQRGTRWIGLLGCLGVFTVYLARDNTPLNFAVLLSPVATLIGWTMLRELRDPPEANVVAAIFRAQLWLVVGSALPLLGLAAAYASAGLLDELVFNTLTGLPQMLDWFVPLPKPGLSTLLFGLAVGAALLALRLGTAGLSLAPARRNMAVAGAGGIAGAAALALGIRMSHGAVPWVLAAADLFVLIPFALTWGGIALVLGRRRPGEGESAQPLLLFTFFAATSLLYFYPASDAAHVLMSMPAILPLAAPCLAAVSDRRSSWAGVLLVLLLAAPFVWVLGISRYADRIDRLPIERASGIHVPGELYHDGARLIHYLRSPANRERSLIVISGKPFVYFLADRPSPVDAYEYAFYLAGLGVLGEADAGELVDDPALLRTLGQERPLVIADDFDESAARFARAFPISSSGIRKNTSVVKQLGGFEVRDWSDLRGDAGGDSNTLR